MVAPVNPPDLFATMADALPKMRLDPKARELVQALSDREPIRDTALVRWLVAAVIEGEGEPASPALFASWKGSDIGDALHVLTMVLVCPWPPVALPFASSLSTCLLAGAAAIFGSKSQEREAKYLAERYINFPT